MAKKRPSLRDKNVFKRSKDLDALFGSPEKADDKKPASKSKTETAKPKTTAKKSTSAPKKPAPKKTRARKNTSTRTPRKTTRAKSKTAATPVDDLAALAATASENFDANNTPKPRENLSVSMGGSPAEDLPIDEFGFNIDDLPVALETAPNGPLTAHLPANEAGDVANELNPLIDFPAAMEAPLSGMPTEDMPSEEIGDMEFPTAMAVPPGGAPTENMPSGEIGDNTTPLDIDDFPVATTPENMPSGEIGDDTTPLDIDDFDLSHSALAEVAPPAENAPIPFPAAESSPPTAAWTPAPDTVTSASAASISRENPLYFGTETELNDMFDFRSVAAEAATLPFELPANIEDLSPEERKERERLLNDPRIREQFIQIYNAIDAEYEHILDDNISVSKEITDWAHKLLAETRQIVMNYQIKYLAKAEWNIEQVRARFDRAEESAKQAEKWSRWLIVWGMLWFVVFVYLIFNPDYLLKYLVSNDAISDLLVPDIFLRSLFFGAIGGVAAVFHSLLRYITKRTFDVEYVLSYFVKPFMGMIVGTLIYLIVFVVMRPFGLTPTVLNQTGADGTQTSRLIFEVLSYFLATAAGFKENLVFDLLNKTLKILFRDSDTDTDIEPPLPPPGPFSKNTA